MQISETGGTPRQLTAPDDGDFHKHVSYLPDGGALVFVIGQRGSNPNPDNRIAVLSLKSGDQKTLLHGETPHATSNGQLIYFKDHSLWAVNLDRDRLDISNESMPIVHGVHYAYDAHFSVSTRGTLVYVLPTKLIERQLVWIDRTGNEETIALDRRPYSMPRVSPDGDRIAVVVESDAGPDLWVYSISRSDGIRLTFEESRESMPVWSPESKYVYFNARATNDIFRVSADGSGATEPILVGAPNYWPVDFSPDGNLLLFEEYDARANSMGVRTIDLSEQPKIADLITAPFEEGEAVVSPDGKWLAYASNRTGQFEVYIRPYPNIEAPLIAVSVGGGSLPSWGVDGRELFYKGRDHMMGVKVYIGPTLTVGKPEHLFSTDAYVHETTGNFDYDPTRDRFLIEKRPSEYDMSRERIVIVQNWLEEVSRTLASN
jgi:Tol biopolymer transport system component